jgi:N-methylhydantoinase B
MIAACNLRQRRLRELAQHFDAAQLQAGFEARFHQAERAVRTALSAVPDGCYEFADYVDSDCVSDTPFRIHVALDVKGDTVTADFREPDDQAAGPINFLMHPDNARSLIARTLIWRDPAGLLNDGVCAPIPKVLLRG